ncbi:MAG: AAA family ATPase [bacterium]
MMPKDIYKEINKDIIGQDEMLRFVSVAIFKHVLGEKFGNLLLIGNSGTGKTATMQAMERMYARLDFFKDHRVVIRMNANTLAEEDEGGVVKGRRLFRMLDERARLILGNGKQPVTPENLKKLIEHGTVCVDEIDKISSRIGGKPNVLGIAIQQSLLTLMEGEDMLYDTSIIEDGQLKQYTIPIDTGNILFICGGAYEELYNQVYSRIFQEGKQEKLSRMIYDEYGKVQFKQIFTLKDNLMQEDLFVYGVLPQFLSRFDNAVVLNDLSVNDLLVIFQEPEQSVYKRSKAFFKKFDVELSITERAARMIAHEAANHPRVGARALKEVYGKVIKLFEYDPYSAPGIQEFDGKYELLIDEDIVKKTWDIE